jgi:nucleoside-diphosphate-sugar epimerase
MSILLTGGSGFIGGHFHNYLEKSQLINFDLVPPSQLKDSIFFQGDIRLKEDLRKVFGGHKIDTIISLAAKHHDFGIGHDEYFDTNEEGTRMLCEVAAEFNVNKIVFYSSVAVYGLLEKASSENFEPNPSSPYGASKLAGEEVLKKWASGNPQRSVLIMRPALVFGANNRANMFNLIKQIDSGLYFHLGKASNVKSIAYVENLVMATLYLKDKIPSGFSVYNYADEPQLSSREIADVIANALRKKVHFTFPLWLGLGLALPFDIIIKITGKNLPISSARVRKLATETQHSAIKVKQSGFYPNFTTREGLIKMVNWYKQNKN